MKAPRNKDGDAGRCRVNRPGAFCRRVSRFLVYWPVLLLPMTLGGARPYLWGFTASVFLGAFAILVPSLRRGTQPRIIRWPLLLLFPLLLYPFLQALPLPLGILSVLSPRRAEWVQRSIDATGIRPWGASISYVPLDTFAAGLWVLTLVLFAWVLHRSLREEIITPSAFLTVLFLVAGFEALLGIVQAAAPAAGFGPGAEFARGTFANHNHYAAFLGMIWPLQLARLLGPVGGCGSPARGWDERRAGRFAFEKRIFFVFLIGLVILGLVLSGSRGGILSMVIGCVVLVYLGGKGGRKPAPLLVACLAVVLVYCWIIGVDGIVRHFARFELDAPYRLRIWGFTWSAVRDHWLTGVGIGAYRSAIFLYQVFDTDLAQVGVAHNDYLQIASECGLPFGCLIVFLAWGWWLWSALECSAESRSLEPPAEMSAKLLRAGALAAAAAFLAHSWVEFNWQIPANQLYFVILLVLAGRGPGQRTEENGAVRARPSGASGPFPAPAP